MTELAHSGYAVVNSVITQAHARDIAAETEHLWAGRSTRKGGVRAVFSRCAALRALLDLSEVRELVGGLGDGRARPVRSILFDKTPDANWHVPWHQDTTIAVAEKHHTPGYGPWSVKDGVPHCRPPRHVLEAMFTLRIHLDECHRENGPLRVIPGTHRGGILNDLDLAEASRQAHVECTVEAGGALIMHPLLVHSSPRSTRPDHRRVLHVEFCTVGLDGRLSWCEGL